MWWGRVNQVDQWGLGISFKAGNRIRRLDEKGCGSGHLGAGVPSDGEGHDAVVVKAGGGGVGKGTVR